MLYKQVTYSFLMFFTILSTVAKAQQLYIESGVESAFFKDYVNNRGENSLDLSYPKSQEFFIESGLRLNIYKERLKLNLGGSYNTYKINTGFFSGESSIPLTYNLTYVSIKSGFIFNIINEPRFKFQAHTHLSYDWLYKGTSTFRGVVNDLYNDNTYDKTLIRFHKGLSVEYNISNKIATYISYNITDSFREKNEDSNIEESYVFHTNAISMGMIFNILSRREICYGGF
ncbi:hypothetical protein [Polaribacter ponticola]|uniref:Outer membrane protein beta-barrel domain-containing protein n=1 Tax=Polaribacter ponticola TaxID=2978475 RepID=A0ABT5SAC2_9FLAO|nr:hypothetical protein [Polaribacter sp. MSW5]MDD7914252.1 hypothetical protein [Polaribacter sp. MSW5]